MKPTEVYILKQSPHFQELLFYVINVVEKELPESELLLKWGVPYFYYKKKPFCYLATNKKKQYLDVGFAKGFQLTIHQDILVDENRNTVKSLRYYNFESVDDKVVREVIKEASLLY